jgi:putative sugar O-methyltransferase
LLHSYTLHRLQQLGVDKEEQVVEIGGGFGCLAQLSARAGYQRYAIYDLPWVNAIQGYYLIMSLPPDTVRLYGETEGSIEVNPFWKFESLADNSIDCVVNTDSLPEMGRHTAFGYIQEVRRVLKGVFLSINQEAKADNAGVGHQNSVAELVSEAGGLKRLVRCLYWMRQGYVEEVYAPSR